MELNELIRLADEALAEPAPSDKGIELLERYTLAFDEWFGKNEPLIREHHSSLDQSALQTLVARHEAILAMSEKAQERYPEDMRKLRQRGKGLLAYTDVLPKKISYKKPKEG